VPVGNPYGTLQPAPMTKTSDIILSPLLSPFSVFIATFIAVLSPIFDFITDLSPFFKFIAVQNFLL
jgi:hypothetical protein